MNTCIVLHGALGFAGQFNSLPQTLPDGRPLLALNLPGHGGEPGDALSLPAMAASVLAVMDKSGLDQVDFFGYSMGGYLALWMAWQYPARVGKVVTLGTKLHWTPEVAAGMVRMFDAEKIEAKAPALAAALSRAHGEAHWKALCRHTSAFLLELGNGQGISRQGFASIACPVCIGWGDQDNVVSEAESRETAGLMPDARFSVLPGVPHLVDQINPAVLQEYIFREL